MTNTKIVSEPLKASILIDSYNYGAYLPDAIESALAQTHPNLEVIVIDDGSTDGSAEITARYEPRIKSLFKPNGGQASAFNAGVKLITGDVLFLLDADDICDANRVSTVLELYNQNKDSQWIFHQLRRVGKDGKTLIEPELPPVIQHFDLRNKPFKFPALSTSGLSFRRSMLPALFPMPEAPGNLVNDNYLKFASVLTAPGIYMGGSLGSLRLHGSNDCSAGQPLPYKLHSDMIMALELHRRHPELAHFTDKLASGTAASSWTWGDGGTPVKALFEEYLQSLSYAGRGRMLAGTAIRTLRNHLVGPTRQTHGQLSGLSWSPEN